MPKRREIPVILLLAALVAMAALPSRAFGGRKAKKERWETGADRRKADYIYMEALKRNTLGNEDSYFELLRRAVALDSTDTQPSFNLGYYYLALGQQDTTLAKRGYDMMRAHFNANPSDYYSSIFYGMINNQLGNNREAVRVWQILDSLNPSKPDIALKYAQALQTLPDAASLRKSIEVLNRLERAEGADLGLTSHKIRSMLALQDTAAILGEVNALLGPAPNATNSIYAGDVMMALNRPDSAIAYYNRACEIDPANGLGYYKRAEFYRERGDSAAFDREVFEAVKQEGLEPEVKLEILSSYVRQLYTDTLQQPRIQGLFDTLLIQHPHEAAIRDLYSSYLVAIDDFRGAAEQQEYALDIEPASANRWRQAMSLYARVDDYPKILEMSDRALKYLPTDPMILFYRGSTLGQLNRPAEAVAEFHKALEATPAADHEMQSNILCALGDEYYRQELPDSAFAYYDRALEQNPDNLLALNNCAYFMAEQNLDLDKAEKMSAICVRQNPENSTSLDTYAWILFKKKDYAAAKDAIDRALALDAEAEHPNADVLAHAGDIYYMSGDPEGALEFWKEALELDPSNTLLQKKVKHKTHFYE